MVSPKFDTLTDSGKLFTSEVELRHVGVVILKISILWCEKVVLNYQKPEPLQQYKPDFAELVMWAYSCEPKKPMVKTFIDGIHEIYIQLTLQLFSFVRVEDTPAKDLEF